MSLQDYLNKDFEERKEENPEFSLRKYAKFLDVDPSLLSKILRGQRAPSEEFIKRIQKKITLPAAIRTQLTRLESVPQTKSGGSAYWFSPLIFAYAKATGKIDADFLCEQLGVDSEMFDSAIRYLLSERILEETDEGWKVLTETHHFVTNLSDEERHRFQSEIADFWVRSIRGLESSERINFAMSIGAKASQLPVVHSEIEKFYDRLNSLILETEEPDCIYQLILGWYPALKLPKS